jgi:predicted Zn-dependent protease
MSPMRKPAPKFLLSLLTRALLVTTASLLVACAANPTGGTDFVLMSEKSELEKGKELHEQTIKEQPIYRDEELAAYVNGVGQKLAAISHRPELTYTFTIIDSPDINAFALPGGYVYINRGLMTFLTSEAQLAAVLGHEIGHITARHAVRQQTAARSGNILTTTASIASVLTTGTNVLGETAGLFGGALISGYGREMELEADGLGAEYLQKAGYDPNAMVEVITVLKNHEDFLKRTSNRGSAYHGLFATHPRNDTRLKEAVGRAGTASAAASTVDPSAFRLATTGLVIGATLQNMTGAEARNRYYQKLLNYTIVLPDEWTREETPTTMTASAPENKATLKVEAVRLNDNKEPRLFIRDNLNIPDLQKSEQLSQFGLPGFTGIRPDTGERIAVLYYGQRAFILTGSGTDDSFDNAMLASIKSFRPIQRNEGVFANPVTLEWIQADGRVNYASLARQSRIPEFPEETLRLMNGDYPAGEPQAGEWIKIAN